MKKNTLRDRINQLTEADAVANDGKTKEAKSSFRSAIASMIAAERAPELFKKDDTLRAALADGGLLLPEEAADFLRKAVNNSALLQVIRVHQLSRPEMTIPKLTINQFIVRRNTEAVEMTSDNRSKVNLSQLDITLIRERVQMDISLDILEDNIEGEGMLQTVEDHMFETLGANLDDILLTANTSGTDIRTGIDFTDEEVVKEDRDGLIALAVAGGQTVANTISRDTLLDLIKQVPPKYRRRMNNGQGGMMFVMNPNDVIELKRSFGDRPTNAADVVYLDGKSSFAIDGVPVLEDDNMPEGYVIYTNPKNVVWAASVHNMRVDKVFKAELGVYKIITRLYYGFDFQEIEGVAILTPAP